ncbi:hypothetical protein AVEN_180092-1 [Araneus ventricosus]|uniref:Uncharacterized protein n=1 Tax=Araneus ventricosus TaxID=182803 RepID=A0A4Y2RW01_ARAVE|nr:hypothetical protein AVEN_180092-1 [Araneus ventricosus]
MTYTGGNLFQKESLGDYSYLGNKNIENSTISNQYIANEESLPLIQQCLQKNKPIHPTQVYQGNRKISEELLESFNIQSCLLKTSQYRTFLIHSDVLEQTGISTIKDFYYYVD